MDQKINQLLSQSRAFLERSFTPSLKFDPKIFVGEIHRIYHNQPLDRNFLYFHSPTATLALALEIGFSKTSDEKFLDTLLNYYRHWVKRGKRLYYLDQVMNGYALIYLFKNHQEDWIEDSLKTIYLYIKNYPPTNGGSLPYRMTSPQNVLVDYLGMVCPFLSRYGETFNCKEASHFAVRLLNDYLLKGIDLETRLPYHGFKSDNNEKLGIIGWGRGVGWLLIGMVDTLAFLDRSSDEFYSLNYDFQAILDSTIKYQDKDGYFKWMLSAKGGHIDTSATSMIGYSIKRALDLNLNRKRYTIHAEKSLCALLQSTKGGLVFDSLADCDGIGLYPQRYESNIWGQGFGTVFAATMII